MIVHSSSISRSSNHSWRSYTESGGLNDRSALVDTGLGVSDHRVADGASRYGRDAGEGLTGSYPNAGLPGQWELQPSAKRKSLPLALDCQRAASMSPM